MWYYFYIGDDYYGEPEQPLYEDVQGEGGGTGAFYGGEVPGQPMYDDIQGFQDEMNEAIYDDATGVGADVSACIYICVHVYIKPLDMCPVVLVERVGCQRDVMQTYFTVEPLMKDSSKYGQPPYKG